VDKAESEYEKILEITSDHVESLIGLGEVYTAMAEDGDGDMYDRAIEYFTRGKKTGESGEGSKRLKKKELAALLYSRGYARVKLYEAPKTRRDEKQLGEAERDFKVGATQIGFFYGHTRSAEPASINEVVPKAASVEVAPVKGDVAKGKEVKSTSKPEAVAPGAMGAGYYALLSFGSLIFMIAGLYLPQILKLKVAGIELEKSSVDQITTAGSLGIRK